MKSDPNGILSGVAVGFKAGIIEGEDPRIETISNRENFISGSY
jgi:hypothetical protein